MSDPNELLHALAKVLLRCFLLGVLLLLVWGGFFLLAGDWTYRINSRWFDLTRHEFELIQYCGIVLAKVWVLLFFLFPYVAIRLVLRKRTS
jgi:hypothetical protein